MLEVGVDVTWLARDRRGMGRFVGSALQRLERRDDVRVTRMSRTPGDADTLRWGDARAARLDVCWFPWNRVDFVPPTACVVTIHDTAAFDWPVRGPLAFLDNRKAQKRLRDAAACADRVMTVSGFSRGCIMRHLGVDAARIDVVVEGVDFAAPSQPEPAAEPFVLFLGAADPRKNLDGLLRAWERLADPTRSLWIAGTDGPPADRVRYLGAVPDERLPHLYATCDLFVFPSHYEGFGLPLLEAMACGAPVAAARAASLPEIGGEVPRWFDPADPEDMARTLRAALADEAWREGARAAGMRHAAAFTWDRCADQVVGSLRAAAAQASVRS